MQSPKKHDDNLSPNAHLRLLQQKLHRQKMENAQDKKSNTSSSEFIGSHHGLRFTPYST